MIIDKIQEYLNSTGKEINQAILEEVSLLAAYSFKRQFGTKDEVSTALRLSSIGDCTRKQAYTVLGYPANGKDIDAKARMVFFQGDMVEMAIVQLMKLSGLNITNCGKEQEKLYLEGIAGHPDGTLHTKTEDFLVSIKSMSSYAFDEFQRGDISEGYLYQENAYLEAKGLNKSVYVGLNKDAGVLHEHVIIKNPEIVAQIKANIKEVKSATKETLPPRKFSPNEKGFLPWNCYYCKHWKTCWPDGIVILEKKKYRLNIGEKIDT